LGTEPLYFEMLFIQITFRHSINIDCDMDWQWGMPWVLVWLESLLGFALDNYNWEVSCISLTISSSIPQEREFLWGGQRSPFPSNQYPKTIFYLEILSLWYSKFN
jgi:hypothetical protein